MVCYAFFFGFLWYCISSLNSNYPGKNRKAEQSKSDSFFHYIIPIDSRRVLFSGISGKTFNIIISESSAAFSDFSWQKHIKDYFTAKCLFPNVNFRKALYP
jgi:hypothetical protein